MTTMMSHKHSHRPPLPRPLLTVALALVPDADQQCGRYRKQNCRRRCRRQIEPVDRVS